MIFKTRLLPNFQNINIASLLESNQLLDNLQAQGRKEVIKLLLDKPYRIIKKALQEKQHNKKELHL